MSNDPKRMFGPDGREWSFATNAPHEPSPVARACDGCAAPIGGVTRLCDTCLVVVSCGPKHILDRIDGADDEIARLRAENASLLARLEQAERERDEVKANEAEMQEHIYNYQDHYMREAKRAERAEADGERRMLWLMAIAAIVQFDQDVRSGDLACARGESVWSYHGHTLRTAKAALRALGRDVHADLFDVLRDYGGTKWAEGMLR